MLTPLISIIIPIYKVEQYLRRCLDSIISQTYLNLEIILVDDGSPDYCPQICDEYAAKDKRIKVIHKKNGGLSDARNAGIGLATGEYLFFLDSDDELPLDAIKKMVNQVQQHTKAEVIVGKMYCPQDESLYKNQLFNEVKVFNANTEFRKYYSGYSNIFPVNACNKLISRKFLIDKQLFFKKGIIHEDELWSYLASKFLNYIVCINDITYIRHLNPGSITTSSSDDLRFHSWGLILEEIFSKMDEPAFINQFFKYFMLLNEFYFHINKKNIGLYNNVWKESILCAKRNGYSLLAFSLYWHRKFINIFHGHGTGLVIWILLTKYYSANLPTDAPIVQSSN
ncbi:MAG: glycosyltransferase family 2 protein [Fibrobacter sp.]|nr:glycosyltransferase family 2 protein [Fibrobacter sp.]